MQYLQMNILTTTDMVLKSKVGELINIVDAYLRILFPQKIDHYLTKKWPSEDEYDLTDTLMKPDTIACFVRHAREYKIIEIYYVFNGKFKNLVSFKTNIKNSDDSDLIYHMVRALDQLFDNFTWFQMLPTVVLEMAKIGYEPSGQRRKYPISMFKLHLTKESLTVKAEGTDIEWKYGVGFDQTRLKNLCLDWTNTLKNLDYAFELSEEIQDQDYEANGYRIKRDINDLFYVYGPQGNLNDDRDKICARPTLEGAKKAAAIHAMFLQWHVSQALPIGMEKYIKVLENLPSLEGGLDLHGAAQHSPMLTLTPEQLCAIRPLFASGKVTHLGNAQVKLVEADPVSYLVPYNQLVKVDQFNRIEKHCH